MPRKRRAFSAQYKAEIVKLIRDSGKSVGQGCHFDLHYCYHVANHLPVSESSLERSIDACGCHRSPSGGSRLVTKTLIGRI